MKKTFNLTHEKIKLPRKKYLKRERRRTLPEDADYWDFDCRFGVDEESSEVIHVSEINKSISWAESENLDSFYLEVMVKPCSRIRTSVLDVKE